jgi:hypothetical protein
MARMIGVVTAVAACLVAGRVAAEPGDPPGWETYRNGQHFFSVCYPPKLLVAQPEDDNGRTFKGPHGSEVKAYATPAGGMSLATKLDADIKDEIGLDGLVTYKVVKPGPSGWFALSGRHGAMIFYEKVYRVEGVFQSLAFSYSSRDTAFYSHLIGRMNACFGIGGMGQDAN